MVYVLIPLDISSVSRNGFVAVVPTLGPVTSAPSSCLDFIRIPVSLCTPFLFLPELFRSVFGSSSRRDSFVYIEVTKPSSSSSYYDGS